jgi:hypothetical protein
MNKNIRMTEMLTQAGASIRNLVIVGRFVHIDSYAKYESLLRSVMTEGGFRCIKVSDGQHMDGTVGYRIVFKLQG